MVVGFICAAERGLSRAPKATQESGEFRYPFSAKTSHRLLAIARRCGDGREGPGTRHRLSPQNRHPCSTASDNPQSRHHAPVSHRIVLQPPTPKRDRPTPQTDHSACSRRRDTDCRAASADATRLARPALAWPSVGRGGPASLPFLPVNEIDLEGGGVRRPWWEDRAAPTTSTAHSTSCRPSPWTPAPPRSGSHRGPGGPRQPAARRDSRSPRQRSALLAPLFRPVGRRCRWGTRGVAAHGRRPWENSRSGRATRPASFPRRSLRGVAATAQGPRLVPWFMRPGQGGNNKILADGAGSVEEPGRDRLVARVCDKSQHASDKSRLTGSGSGTRLHASTPSRSASCALRRWVESQFPRSSIVRREAWPARFACARRSPARRAGSHMACAPRRGAPCDAAVPVRHGASGPWRSCRTGRRPRAPDESASASDRRRRSTGRRRPPWSPSRRPGRTGRGSPPRPSGLVRGDLRVPRSPPSPRCSRCGRGAPRDRAGCRGPSCRWHRRRKTPRRGHTSRPCKTRQSSPAAGGTRRRPLDPCRWPEDS